MRLIVQKYGGTSVGDTAKICNVARRLWKRSATVAASSQSFQQWPA
jgi:aspartokinase